MRKDDLLDVHDPYDSEWTGELPVWTEVDRLELEHRVLDAIIEKTSLRELETLYGKTPVLIARKRLVLWGCLDLKGRITQTGKLVHGFDSLLIPHALMMVEAIKRDVVGDVATLIAIFEIGMPVHSMHTAKLLVTLMHEPSDALAHLQIYRYFQKISIDESELYSVHHDNTHAIAVRRSRILSDMGIDESRIDRGSIGSDQDIRACILAGFYLYLYKHNERREYTRRGDPCYAWTTAGSLLKKSPWILGFPSGFHFGDDLFDEEAKFTHVLPRRTLIGCTEVQPMELVRLHPELTSRTRSGHRYDRALQAFVFDKKTFYLGHLIKQEHVVLKEPRSLIVIAKALHEPQGKPRVNPSSDFSMNLYMTIQECTKLCAWFDASKISHPTGDESKNILGEAWFQHLLEYGYLVITKSGHVLADQTKWNETEIKIIVKEANESTFLPRVMDRPPGAATKIAWRERIDNALKRAKKRKMIDPDEHVIPIEYEFRVTQNEAECLLHLYAFGILSPSDVRRMIPQKLIHDLCSFGYFDPPLRKIHHFQLKKTRFRICSDEDVCTSRFRTLPPEDQHEKTENWWIDQLSKQLTQMASEALDIDEILREFPRLPRLVRACLLYEVTQGRPFQIFKGGENSPPHYLGLQTRAAFRVYISDLAHPKLKNKIQPVLDSRYKNGWTHATYTWAQNPFMLVSSDVLERYGIPHRSV